MTIPQIWRDAMSEFDAAMQAGQLKDAARTAAQFLPYLIIVAGERGETDGLRDLQADEAILAASRKNDFRITETVLMALERIWQTVRRILATATKAAP